MNQTTDARRPLAPTTIPQLDGAEPELGADLEGERPDLDPQGDPGPEHPEDPEVLIIYVNGIVYVCMVLVCVPYYHVSILSSPSTITFRTMNKIMIVIVKL